MVEILCPHCEMAIELDDDAAGEFACPHCEGEFEWNMDTESELYDGAEVGPIFGLSRNQLALGAMIIGLVLGIFAVSIGANTVYGFGDCPEESRIYSETDNDELSYSCDEFPDYGGALAGLSLCGGLFSVACWLVWFGYLGWKPAVAFHSPEHESSPRTFTGVLTAVATNVGVSGSVVVLGVVFSLVGLVGLYFSVVGISALLEPQGDSFSNIGIVVFVPLLGALALFCCILVYFGAKFLITVMFKHK